MTTEFIAYLFETAPTPLDVRPIERFRCNHIRVRWSLPFGLQRAEITVSPVGRGRFNEYRAYQYHLSRRMAVFASSDAQQPIIDGYIYEVRLNTDYSLTYILAGPGRRLEDRVDNTNYPNSHGPTDVFEEQYTNYASSFIHPDRSNIDYQDTRISRWTPDKRSIADTRHDLIAMSDPQYTQYDQYFKPSPVYGNAFLGLNKIYHKRRPLNGEPDWVVSTCDLSANSLSFNRHIWEYKTRITVFYNHPDNGEPSEDPDVPPGASSGGVNGPGNHGGGGGNAYGWYGNGNGNGGGGGGGGSTNPDFKWASVSVTSNNEFPWPVDYNITLPGFVTDTQALQYANMLLRIYERPIMQTGFTISAPFVSRYLGSKVPLWRILSEPGGFIQIRGLMPGMELFSELNDRSRTFFIVAMDYDSKTNRLRIVPDTEDSRLDMILKRFGIVKGEMITTNP